MAEAAAAFYAVETAVEGAALGAIAVSKATVPLRVKFQKIKSPDSSLGRTDHSVNIVDNRAYIFGGDVQDRQPDNAIRCITLPTDLALRELDADYQLIRPEAAPERPLASYSDEADATNTTSQPNEVPTARAAHTASTVGSNIYVFGGRTAALQSSSDSSFLEENGAIQAFSILTNKWTTLHPHQTLCAQGVPPPRVNASLTSSPHPIASKSISPSLSTDTEHQSGTLFLHSGYSSTTSHTPLRDVWAFDISSHVWTKYPDIPDPGPSETAGEGKLICFDSRLWRVGDAFGVVHYLDLVRDKADDAWGDATTELGVSPKTGSWEKLSFIQDQAPPSELSAENDKSQQDILTSPTAKADTLPIPRHSGHLLPITTGAGREYLLYFLGSSAPSSRLPITDIWSFQIPSDKKSLAKAKDVIREKVGRESGVHQWARCEIVQATKSDGELERPVEGLEGAAADGWGVFGGGKVVVWGGRGGDGSIRDEGWVVSVD